MDLGRQKNWEMCITNKYKDLDVVFVSLEIGVLGHHNDNTVRALQLNSGDENASSIIQKETAVSCSKRIFQARAIPCWNSVAPYYNS